MFHKLYSFVWLKSILEIDETPCQAQMDGIGIFEWSAYLEKHTRSLYLTKNSVQERNPHNDVANTLREKNTYENRRSN